MTDPRLLQLLDQHATRTDDGRYHFGDSRYPHSLVDALAIVEACDLLDMPITDTLSSQAWLALVRTVLDLRRRVDQLTAPTA